MLQQEKKFFKVVETICARPGLYLGQHNFFALAMFLEGYVTAMAQQGKFKRSPLGGLLTLLEQAHGFSHPAWGWARHYLHEKETDERAIREFPQFLREALEVPDSRIKEIHRSRARLGSKPPRSPQTTKYYR